MCEGDTIEAADINLPASEVRAAQTAAGSNERPVDTAERSDIKSETNPLSSPEQQVILSSLRTSGWNVSRTAEARGMSRNTLYRKMRRHGIRSEPH